MTNTNEIIRELKAGILHKPDFETIRDWTWNDGGCEAACKHSCWVEPDGHCPHGRPSWLIFLGLI